MVDFHVQPLTTTICTKGLQRSKQSSSKWSEQTTILYGKVCEVHLFPTKSRFNDFLSPAGGILTDKV